MSGLLMILLIVFLISNSNKKKKRGQAVRSMPARTPVEELDAVLDDADDAVDQALEIEMPENPPRPPEAARHPEPVIRAVNPEAARRPETTVQAANPSRVRQGESMLRDAECAGGSMAHTHAEGHSALADEDCVGGSMAHTHTEGVSRVVHARRMAAIDASHDDSDVLPETIDARALRRAVVMAEVLGKPRALRR